MKRILLALALLVFVGSIEAAMKTPRATTKRTKTADSQNTQVFLPAESYNVEPNASLKDRIATLKHNIEEAHAQVNHLHKQIHGWTRELAPLEVQAHHAKASKGMAKSVHTSGIA